jgi:hypothetical protein
MRGTQQIHYIQHTSNVVPDSLCLPKLHREGVLSSKEVAEEMTRWLVLSKNAYAYV